MKAYVNIETKPKTSIELVRRLRERGNEIISADAIYGRFDVICVVEAPTLEDIDQLVYDVIQSDPSVTRTETSIVLGLKAHK